MTRGFNPVSIGGMGRVGNVCIGGMGYVKRPVFVRGAGRMGVVRIGGAVRVDPVCVDGAAYVGGVRVGGAGRGGVVYVSRGLLGETLSTMPPTAGEALASTQAILAAAGVETPRLDAQLLLAWAMHCRREDLARDPEQRLSGREALVFHKAVDLRALRRPLPYITGEQWFYGRPFKLNRAVLIPRPETELLVDAALEAVAGTAAPRVADIGTGSGCVAVSVACARPDASVVATDLSPLALNVARKNAVRHDVSERVLLWQGDLLAPLADVPPFHVIVSNPPYISEAEMPGLQPEVREYEPRLALSGEPGATGPRGDALHRRLLEGARAHLVPGGTVLLEVGHGQAEEVATFARGLGYNRVNVLSDLAGIGRVVRAGVV